MVEDPRRKSASLVAASPEALRFGGLQPDEIDRLCRQVSVAHDRGGRLIFASLPFQKLVGWDCAARLGRRGPHPWWPRGRGVKAREQVREVVSQGLTHSRSRGRLLAADGASIPVRWEYRRLASGRQSVHLLIFQTRPSIERAALALSLIDSLPVGVAAQDASGDLTFLNRASVERLGVSREDVEGRPVAEILGEENRHVWSRQLQERKAGRAAPYSLSIATPRGAVRAAVFPTALFDPDGSFAGSTGILVPFSEVEALVQTEIGDVLAPAVSALSSALAKLTEASAFTRSPPRTPPDPTVGSLTPRERELFRRALSGGPARGLATDLGISPDTVRNHLRSIYRKLGVRSRVELVARFARGPGSKA